MDTNTARNELKVTVLMGLAGICTKVAENEVVPNDMRAQAREFLAKFNSLLPVRGKGNAYEHAQGEQLLASMARFLAHVIEIESMPSGDRGPLAGEE